MNTMNLFNLSIIALIAFFTLTGTVYYWMYLDKYNKGNTIKNNSKTNETDLSNLHPPVLASTEISSPPPAASTGQSSGESNQNIDEKESHILRNAGFSNEALAKHIIQFKQTLNKWKGMESAERNVRKRK